MPSVPSLNFGSLFGLRTLNIQQRAVNQSLERLATGRRINRASDDPTGTVLLTATEARKQSIQSQIKSLEFESLLNATTSDAYGQVADGLIRLNELVVQAANVGAASPDEREALQVEADAIIQSIDFIATNTTFNGKRILNGQGVLNGTSFEVSASASIDALGRTVFEVESAGPQASSGASKANEQATTPDNAQSLTTLADVPAAASPIASILTAAYSLRDIITGGALNLVDGDVEGAQTVVKIALTTVLRASGNYDELGIQAELSLLHKEFESISKITSTVGDTDFARETSELVRSQVLAEAATQAILINRDIFASTTLGLLGSAITPKPISL